MNAAVLPDDADAPHPTDRPAFELRVLQGPQAGCRLSVTEGQDYTLGSSDACDILLAGHLIQPSHALIRMAGEDIEVGALQGKVVVQGIDIEDDTAVIPIGQAVLVGTAALCIDRVDAPWPTEAEIAADLAAPDDDEPTDDAPLGDDPDEDDDDAIEGDDGDDDDPREDAGYRSPDPLASGVLRMPVAPPPMQPRWRQALPASWVWPSSAAVTLALAAGVALELGIGRSDTPAPAITASQAPALKAASDTPATALPAGAPAPTWTEASVKPPLDALVANLESQEPVSIRWQWEDGRPAVQVSTANAAAAERTAQALESARDTIGPVQLKVLRLKDIDERFQQALEEAGLSRKFTPAPASDTRLNYRAVLALEDIPVWERLFLAFTERYGALPEISVRVSTEHDRMGGLIGSVVGGTFPYIVTPNGSRIAPGGLLLGRTVASVQTGEIVFTDGTRYRFTP